jgi:MoaA/NifB/PqqE/SkfB family radical SAM enzyme
MNLSVMYRGPLASCNYACGYCPFAKRRDTRTQLDTDRRALSRFVGWLEAQHTHTWRVLFTPWGEALVRAWYRDALVRLTRLDHVQLAAAQTNLSCPLTWLEDCQPERLSLWATFHASETSLGAFVRRVMRVYHAGVGISVGMVAVPRFLGVLAELRRALPAEIYVWVNAQQPAERPYTQREVAYLTSIDPLFTYTLTPHRTWGQPCHTGQTVFTVDGQGNMRRCHFVAEVMGNIYDAEWERALRPRVCPRTFCRCYLGFAHLASLGLDRFFGPGLLARRPANSAMLAAGRRTARSNTCGA